MTPDKVVAPPELEEYDWKKELEKIELEAKLEQFETGSKTYWTKRQNKYFPAISGSDLNHEPDIPADFYVEGLICAGVLNGIIGPPKAGKTTYLIAKLLEMVESGDCPGPILYITEQSKRSFKKQLNKMPANIRNRFLDAKLKSGEPAIFVMHPEHHAVPKLSLNGREESDWQRNLRAWKTAVVKLKPAVLVIDTFGRFGSFNEGGENDNGIMAGRLTDLTEILNERDSLAIVLSHHTKKIGDQKKYLTLDDCRGASAFVGGLDHVVMFNRPSRTKGSNVCYLSTESRVTDNGICTETLQADGSFVKDGGDVVDVTPRAFPKQKIIADMLVVEPELAKLSIRDFVTTCQERHLKITKWDVEEYRKNNALPTLT